MRMLEPDKVGAGTYGHPVVKELRIRSGDLLSALLARFRGAGYRVDIIRNQIMLVAIFMARCRIVTVVL